MIGIPISRLARRPPRATLGALIILGVTATMAHGQPVPPQPQARAAASGAPAPFGANLFLGNFIRQQEEGTNPEYVVMPGDRIAVNTWGTVEVNRIFVVDGQGNIFLPGIGPVLLEGVRHRNLTSTVKAHIAKVYRSNFGVYTNLLTAAPVGVFVTGGVARPGRYAGVPSDSVLFFLDQAGGIDPALGSYREIVVLRGDKTIAEVDLYDFVINGKLAMVQFIDGDTILVRRRGPVVVVEGEVASRSLIEFKGPLTGGGALAVMPMLARATAVTIRGVRRGHAFHQTLSIEEFRGVSLEDGDTIRFRDDGRAETILVQLQGEFKGPSLLSVDRGARLLDVLNYVEVDPALTDVSAIHLRRAEVAEAQKKSIEDSLHRLERSAMLALSTTEKEAAIRVKEAELMHGFVQSARLIQPLGRVVTSVRGRQLNILLKEGDTIVIPARSNVVRLSGEVQVAQAVVYSSNMRVRDYVRLAGGYTARANRGKVIIIHASAAVTMANADTRVRPGDEVLITPKVDRKLLQNAADLTQVIYQIAVAAAVVIAL